MRHTRSRETQVTFVTEIEYTTQISGIRFPESDFVNRDSGLGQRVTDVTAPGPGPGRGQGTGTAI